MEGDAAIISAGGLMLRRDAAPTWRIAWRENDWLGPIKLLVQQTAPPLHHCKKFEGRDDLGPYHGIEMFWELQLPVRTRVRAYYDLPIIVFRLEARQAIHELTGGTFAQPSVAW